MNHENYLTTKINYEMAIERRRELESKIELLEKEKYELSRKLSEWGKNIRYYESVVKERGRRCSR